MKSIYIETYGCTLNQADSDIMKGILYDRGYEISNSEAESDIIILNTCTVKGATESKILDKMRTLKTTNKKIVVAGCMSVNTQKIRNILPNAPIVWAGAVAKIDEAVQAAIENKPLDFKQLIRKEMLPKIITVPIMRIPISEGCVSFCHFCQTKLARPGLRSISPEGIFEWIKLGIKEGAKEIQLTSMDAGAYGKDLRTNLSELLKHINQIDGEFYARLGMANPDHIISMKETILHGIQGPRFYKFLHLPVQTGSEKVCKEMNRDHSVKDFVDLVKYSREAVPDISIATDIIVGYPTETEEDFETTCMMIKETMPDIINVSKFSLRKGTKAALLKQIYNQEVKRRSKSMSELVKKIGAEINAKFVGKTYRVLITEKDQKGDYKGRNINYKQVVVKNFHGAIADFVNVKIYDSNYGSLFADIL